MTETATRSGRLMPLLIVTVAVAALMVIWLARQTVNPEPTVQPMTARGLLSNAPEAFRRVTGPQPLNFPQDHGAHPDYRNEWWYFTGNLSDRQGRRFGFHFTLFRFALGALETLDSPFHADQLWMAHLALSDAERGQHFQAERFARGTLGLAGATPERWWLRDWTVEWQADAWHLKAAGEEFALALRLAPTRPLVLQGDAGYSRKGPEPGNASRYYSATRLAADGKLTREGELVEVSGLAWLDREWGSSQLSPDLSGWDWFALQLDDGRDLMVYRLRRDDGTASPFSAGVLVDPDGSYQTLQKHDFTARPQRWWTDQQGASWPVEWQLKLPLAELSMTVEAVFDEQLFTGSVVYWEGAVDVLDTASGVTLGKGYLELSGYAD